MNENEYLLKGEEEISYGPSCYCWDYLKRSGGMGNNNSQINIL